MIQKAIISILLIILISCSSKPKIQNGFEFQKNSFSKDTNTKKIYLIDTKPIDSINPKQVIYDIFRIDYSKYPDSIKVYARPYDSLGNFITNMAFPYNKTDKKYFSKLDERLGSFYNIKTKNVPEFNVREYGKNDSIPFDIMLTLDYSGSIKQLIDVLIEGTDLFVKLKYPYDRIGVNSFNNEFKVKVPMSSDSSTIMNLFRAQKNQDMGLFSAVYDAAFNSISLFDSSKKDIPKVLVLFTDGDDNYSKIDVGEVIKIAKLYNVNIFTVAFGYSIDENLHYLAQYTGGKFYKAYSKEELISVFRDIYNSLRNYYLISYKPPEYWGLHKVLSELDIPGADSLMLASIEYNTGDLTPWSKIEEAFKRPIRFAFNSDTIKEESFYILDEITDAMLTIPRLRLEVQGHTDNVGLIEYNQKLSERRAKAVMDALLSRGISDRRLRYRGFGMSLPISSNETPEGQAQNRRTEFVIIGK